MSIAKQSATQGVVNYAQGQALKRLLYADLLARAKQVSAAIISGKTSTISHEDLKRMMLERRAAHVGY